MKGDTFSISNICTTVKRGFDNYAESKFASPIATKEHEIIDTYFLFPFKN